MGRKLLTRGDQSTETTVNGTMVENDLHLRKDNIKNRIKRKKKKGRNKENSKEINTLFSRQKDGFTSLAILPPVGDGIIPGTEKDRPISLGHLIGRVKVGTSYLYGFREDKRNIVKAMYPISYNFYSSYGPTYDSTFSSLTLEETQLVQTNLDRFSLPQGNQYHDLIKNVCREDYSHTFVDHLIDILEGRDSESSNDSMDPSPTSPNKDDIKEDMDTEDNNSSTTTTPATNDDHVIDFDSLKSLNEEGIDMSFIDGLKEEFETRESELDASRTIEQRLDRTAMLLSNLKASQTSRLNVCPNFNLNQVEQPSDFEIKLASKVLDNLTTILKSTQPGELVESTAVRKAMGVNVPIPQPVTEEDSSTKPSQNSISIDSDPTTQLEQDNDKSADAIEVVPADSKEVVLSEDTANVANLEASKEAPEKETSAPVLDKADVDAKESIVSVNKDQANSEVEKADGETAFNADNSSITKSAGVEVTNTTDPNTNTNTVIDMDTDSLTVDHTGTICSSLTENEITVQN